MCRFAVGACSLQDLANEAHVKAVLAPTPKSVDRNRACRRAYLQRFFEVWRRYTAQRANRSRRACNFPQHLLITSNAQFSGQTPNCTMMSNERPACADCTYQTNVAEAVPPMSLSSNTACFGSNALCWDGCMLYDTCYAALCYAMQCSASVPEDQYSMLLYAQHAMPCPVVQIRKQCS